MQTPWQRGLFEFKKPPVNAFQWPTSSPLHQSPPRFSRRPQLRFSPARTPTEQWVARSLSKAHILLKQGREEAALDLCSKRITLPREDCAKFVHSAVSLFMRHGSFASALDLCNHMIDIGFLVQNKTFMLLLKGDQLHREGFLDEIRETMARGGAKIDNLTFKCFLDAMSKHGYSPKDLEDALESYGKSQDREWVPTLGILHSLIRAWSFAGSFPRAAYWLTKYRGALQSERMENSSKSSRSTRDLPGKVSSQNAHSTHPHSSPLYTRMVFMDFLHGLSTSRKPVAEHIQWLLDAMRQDGISLDTEMYNIIIRSLLNWGMMSRAFRMFDGLLKPGATIVPDAHSFRSIFIALNPLRSKRQEISPQQALSEDISTRLIFFELIRISRLRIRSRKPMPHKNLISTATFNCALRTFCAQNDYAAAWCVLVSFTRFHVRPDAKTFRTVVNSLLQRMRHEMSPAFDITDVVWMDRFSRERRSEMMLATQKMMLADRLYLIGRLSVAEMKDEGLQWYIKPTTRLGEDVTVKLEFITALLRSALLAQLGFHTLTPQTVQAEMAISEAMSRARREMVPRGRSAIKPV